MASSRYNFFGATWQDVVARLGGQPLSIQDFAASLRRVLAGSTQSVIVVESTEGLVAGQKVNINTGVFPPEGETRVVASVDSATQFTVSTPFSAAPAEGDVVNDGPEQLERDLAWAENEVVSLLPARYRRLLSRVEGEVVCRRAAPGQTSVVLCNIPNPFTTSPSNVRLYLNYSGDWHDRRPSDQVDEGDYSIEGRVVTFAAPLGEGDSLLAEYDHDLATPPRILTDATVDLAAYRAAQRAHLDHQGGEVEWVLRYFKEAQGRLGGVATGQRGIPEFDDLCLWADWQRQSAAGFQAGHLYRG